VAQNEVVVHEDDSMNITRCYGKGIMLQSQQSLTPREEMRRDVLHTNDRIDPRTEVETPQVLEI
jgi:hypothetical protein